jgi:glycine cleavage system aminomethyltransferase T
LLLIDIDFNSSKKALIDDQKYTPFEMGLERLVSLDKDRFVGQRALTAEKWRGASKQIVGLEINWPEVEAIYERVGLPPAVSPIASRVAVPVFGNGRQIGKATSTAWSPVLKRFIALATVTSDFARPGSKIEIEMTVEAVRHRVSAQVAKTPFYSPKQKTATPV